MDLRFLAPIGFSVDNGSGVYEIPFLDRMFIVFWVVVAGMVLISKLGARDKHARTLHVDRKLFHVDGAFALGSAVVCLLVAAIYGVWW
jgi:SSS family solute:Na+ symporter